MYGRYYTTGGSLSKPAGLDSTTLNDLLIQGNTSTVDGERQTIYKNLQQELLNESPWVWMFRWDDYYLVGSNVRLHAASGRAAHLARRSRAEPTRRWRCAGDGSGPGSAVPGHRCSA